MGTFTRRGAIGALLALTVTLAGCGDDGGSTVNQPSGSPSGSAGTALFDKLPDRIKQSKKITVGSDVAYAPMEFFDADGKTIIGVDPEIGAALGQKLGVTVTFTNAGFDTLITGLKSRRFDLIMSSMTDNKERQKEVDFVDYFTAGTSILVKKGNPQGISSLDDLCGKTVAVQRETTFEEMANTQKAKCKTDGKGDLTVLATPKDTDAQLQVKTGRAAASMADFPVAVYTATQSGNGNDFEVVGEQIDAGPFGIGVRKDDTQLRDAIQEALKAIIADGTYDTILTKWNAQSGALKTAAVNGG